MAWSRWEMGVRARIELKKARNKEASLFLCGRKLLDQLSHPRDLTHIKLSDMFSLNTRNPKYSFQFSLTERLK